MCAVYGNIVLVWLHNFTQCFHIVLGSRRRSSRINPAPSEEATVNPTEESTTIDKPTGEKVTDTVDNKDGSSDAKATEDETESESPKRKAEEETETSEDTAKKCKVDTDASQPDEAKTEDPTAEDTKVTDAVVNSA